MFKSLSRRVIAAGLLALALVAGAVPFASASVNYGVNVATNRLNVVAMLLNGQSVSLTPAAGSGAGLLVIGTSALSGSTGVLATVTLSASCCTVSAKTLTLAGTPLSANPTASGTAALAELRNFGGGTIASGLTVCTSGCDITVNTTTVAVGVPFTLNSGTITHP